MYNRQCAAVKTTCGIIKSAWCRCSPVGMRRAPDPPTKERERLYEKRIHAGQRRACVGHLSQSSRPQTVSAV